LIFIYADPGDMREPIGKDKGKDKGKTKAWVEPLDDEQEHLEHSPSPQPSGTNPQQDDAPEPIDGADPEPHEDSPAANNGTKKDQMTFLKSLSDDKDYKSMLKGIECIKVMSCQGVMIVISLTF